MVSFIKKLEQRWAGGARVCVGLDPDTTKLPSQYVGDEDEVIEFIQEIVTATCGSALAYKMNAAFYTNMNAWVIDRILAHLREVAPDVPRIFDSKRADIGNTNKGYVDEAFNIYPGAPDAAFDAMTVNPYFGMEAMKPFLDEKEKGIIVLCRTSNPGAGEFQDIILDRGELLDSSPTRLYHYVAERVAKHWNYNNNCLLVVGATYPEELREVRSIVGDDMWLLLPGIGKQGGDVEKAVYSGVNSRKSGIIINSSSGIIFASTGPDYAEAARRETQKLTDEINAVLASIE